MSSSMGVEDRVEYEAWLDSVDTQLVEIEDLVGYAVMGESAGERRADLEALLAARLADGGGTLRLEEALRALDEAGVPMWARDEARGRITTRIGG